MSKPLEHTRRARGRRAGHLVAPFSRGPHLLPATPGRTGTLGCPPRLPGPLRRAAPDVGLQYAARAQIFQDVVVSYLGEGTSLLIPVGVGSPPEAPHRGAAGCAG